MILKVRELMDKWISTSKADVVVLGGDFNAGPVEHEGKYSTNIDYTLEVYKRTQTEFKKVMTLELKK